MIICATDSFLQLQELWNHSQLVNDTDHSKFLLSRAQIFIGKISKNDFVHLKFFYVAFCQHLSSTWLSQSQEHKSFIINEERIVSPGLFWLFLLYNEVPQTKWWHFGLWLRNFHGEGLWAVSLAVGSLTGIESRFQPGLRSHLLTSSGAHIHHSVPPCLLNQKPHLEAGSWPKVSHVSLPGDPLSPVSYSTKCSCQESKRQLDQINYSTKAYLRMNLTKTYRAATWSGHPILASPPKILAWSWLSGPWPRKQWGRSLRTVEDHKKRGSQHSR
jgi:hypothetical protein